VTRSELDLIDHVVRGALNTALLNLQLLSSTCEPDERSGPLLERARAEIRRVAEQLLPSALDIVALEVTHPRPVALRPLVERTLAHTPELDRVVLTPGVSPVLTGDPDVLAVAIAHLARNAVAASPPGEVAPHIDLVETADATVALLVRNLRGPEAPPVTAGTIPGRRGHLGGVVAVNRIARLHGGTLSYEAVDGWLVARLTVPARVEGR
jgi:signal transduction histidine kinase